MATNKAEQVVKKKTTEKVESEGSGFKLSTAKEFANDVKVEFGKISWPSRKNTIASTVVVVILVVLISCYLAVVDLSVGKLIGSILK